MATIDSSILTVVRVGPKLAIIGCIADVCLGGQLEFAISRYVSALSAGLPSGLLDHHFIGGKWTGIFDFFRQNPETVDRYEYFWFPDDDIETSAQDAVRFVDIVMAEGFKLAQPALTADSYYAHPLLVANPRFAWRRSNLVELMMPIMHRSVLKRVLPLFEGRHAALGLDYFWHQLTDDPQQDVAIVDAVPMGHRRPRQVHLKGRMTKMQIDIFAERDRTFEEFTIRRQPPLMLSARTPDGRDLDRGPRLWLEYARGMASVLPDTIGPPMGWGRVAKTIRQQMTGRSSAACFDRDALSTYS